MQGAQPQFVWVDEINHWKGVLETYRAQEAAVTSGYTKDGIARGRGTQQVLANYDRKMLDEVADWSKFATVVYRLGAWAVYTTPKMEQRVAYIKGEAYVIALHPSTWRTLSMDLEIQGNFLRSMTTGSSGMKFLTMDGGDYAKVARLEAARNGNGVVMAKDLLTQATEDAQRLIVQAAGLASGATQGQMSMFAQQQAELESMLVELESRMDKLRHTVDLAAQTVAGAAG